MRRAIIAVFVLVVVAAAVVYVTRRQPGPDVGSPVVRGGRVRVASTTPRSYEIVYRVETFNDGRVTRVSTDSLVVRRPFDARLEQLSGRPPGRGRASVTVNTFSRLRTDRATFAVPPAPAPLDKRPDAYLLSAVRAHFVEEREVRRVAGRECRVFRIPGGAGDDLKEISDKQTTYVDECFDAAGLLLEEISVEKGKAFSRRVAVSVSESVHPDEDAFRVGAPTIDVRHGGGSVQRLVAGSRPPGKFWDLKSGLPGFRHQGRYAVIPPQTGFDDPLARPRILTFVSDVWTKGIDVVVVEQGSTIGSVPPFQAARGMPYVRLGALGRGQLIYERSSVAVRVILGGGRFVRVAGTVPSSVLIEVARNLTATAGGDLVVEQTPAPSR